MPNRELCLDAVVSTDDDDDDKYGIDHFYAGTNTIKYLWHDLDFGLSR